MRLRIRDRRLPWMFFVVALASLAFHAARPLDASRADSSRLRPDPTADDDLLKVAQGRFEALPKDMATADFPVSPGRVKLGRMLFFDSRISVDGTVSCARCHLPSLFGTDGLPKSHGTHDKLLPRNAPTVFNAALHAKQHWRGDVENVEEQATRSLTAMSFGNPDNATAMTRLKAIPSYAEMFKKVFPDAADPVTADNWGKAIGAYERTLVTPSRFDDYLGGKTDALTADERRGLKTFIEIGCANCHGGVSVGGDKFRKFGVKEDYWKATGSKEIDQGRIDVTKDAADLYVFKVPGLRNVEMTPPYFHDGSVGTLLETVRVMSRVQLGKNLSDEETAAIVAFLKCLTGNPPEDFMNAPVLPASGFDTKPLGKDAPNSGRTMSAARAKTAARCSASSAP